MHYIHRVLEKSLGDCLRVFSVVGLTGPRQSGKSTLIQHTLKDYEYVTFDDYQTVNLFKADPQKFMRIYQNKIIFDEVQKVPEIFTYVKQAVDQDRSNTGKFVLTGSSQFSFIKGLSDSLAGRIALLSLLPYQYQELPQEHRENAIIFGSYPEMINKNYMMYKTWYSSYLETYLNRDVAALINLQNLDGFRQLINLLAAQVTQNLNYSKLATVIGIDAKTIKNWINVLEASYILFTLKPYYQNQSKRIVKSPKLFFYDSGLLRYLTGIDSKEQLDKSPLAGPIFENFVISEVIKKEKHTLSHHQAYYYRDSNQKEIDLIIDKNQHKDWIEIKNSETFNPKMLAHIESLMPNQDQGFLLYNGKNRNYTDNIQILNFSEYLL